MKLLNEILLSVVLGVTIKIRAMYIYFKPKSDFIKFKQKQKEIKEACYKKILRSTALYCNASRRRG
jgi:hypothetical protein